MRWVILGAGFLAGIVGLVMYMVLVKGEKISPSISEVTWIDMIIFRHGLDDVVVSQADFLAIKEEIQRHIVGMDGLLNTLLIALFCEGHVLVEGAPGLAKTKVIQSFAQVLHLEFSRIQFTPDLLPSDILGAELYNPKTKQFDLQWWPVVSNVILADEINRTTPKVQSALLEAMQEKQITVWNKTHALPDPFLVLATQNPIEHHGTYPLPEAQLDRFLFKVFVDYPSHKDELRIIHETVLDTPKNLQVQITACRFASIRKAVLEVNVPTEVTEYITKLVQKTRISHPYVQYWASPRASIGLTRACKVLAFMQGRTQVGFQDVQRLFLSVLRHRLVLSYEAQVKKINADEVLCDIAWQVPL